MNRGFRRGLGLDSFWPHNNSSTTAAKGTVPQLDASTEGALGWGTTAYVMPGWLFVGTGTSTYLTAQGPNGLEVNSNGIGGIYSLNSGLGASFIGTEAYSNGATVNMRNSRGTVASPTALQSGDTIGGIRVGSIGSNFATDCGQIYWKTTEIHSSSASGTKFEVYTTPNTTNSKTLGLTVGQDQSTTLAGALTVQDGGTATYTAQPPTIVSAGGTGAPGYTYTLNFASAIAPVCYDASPTFEYQQTANAFGMGIVYQTQTLWKNKSNVAANLKLYYGYYDASIVQADTQTITAGSAVSFYSSPTYNVVSGGVQTGGAHTAFRSSFVVNTGATVATRTGLLVSEATGTGTLTTNIGVDIPALAFGGTNIGIRNLSSLLQKGAQVLTPTAVTVSSNAGTVPVTASYAQLTNSSAATITVTIATSGASDGQIVDVGILDATAASQTITWVNTENGKTTAPTTTLGSTSIRTHARFMFNSTSSKWTCIGL
jgi:hypothetical protein